MSGLIFSFSFLFQSDRNWNLYHLFIFKLDIIVKFYSYKVDVCRYDFATLTCHFNSIRFNSKLYVNKWITNMFT